jgi:hypothetical protein
VPANDTSYPKFVSVTEKEEDFQYIRFTANGALLLVATHDGKMIRFVKEADGTHLKP